jgi:transketolase
MSWHLFRHQDESYCDTVLPTGVRARVSVEAGVTLGWDRWVGSSGRSVGIDHFGASAPWQRLYKEFGVTTDAVVAAAHATLAGS